MAEILTEKAKSLYNSILQSFTFHEDFPPILAGVQIQSIGVGS
jgi:hypothetical protein